MLIKLENSPLMQMEENTVKCSSYCTFSYVF